MGQMIVVVIGRMSVTSELICADGAGIIQKGWRRKDALVTEIYQADRSSYQACVWI